MEWSLDQMGAYFLETSICWAIFYGLYLVFFRDLTFFSINRVYLLLSFLIGLIAPSIQIPSEIANEYVLIGAEFPEIRITAEMGPVEQASAIEAGASNWSFGSILWVIYWIGVCIAASRLIIDMVKIHQLWRSAERVEQNGYTLALTPNAHFPFSFMQILFWSRDYTPEAMDAEHIERHERAHIVQWHSLDILFVELLGIFFWFNPFIYWYKRSLRTVHEYLADAAVLQQTSVKSYGNILLKHIQSGHHFALTHGFIPSQLKQRILMMTKTQSPKEALLKYAVAIPVLILFVLIFSLKSTFADSRIEQPLIQEVATDSLPDNVYKVVEEMPRFPGCEDHEAKKDCAQKKMFEFIFSNIKYPEDARKAGIEGTVVVNFIIDKTGKILNPEIKRSVHGSIDAEVLRIIDLMPNWIPGKQSGKNVAVSFNLPVKFKLDGGKKQAKQEYDVFPIFNTCDSEGSIDERQACSKLALFEYMLAGLEIS